MALFSILSVPTTFWGWSGLVVAGGLLAALLLFFLSPYWWLRCSLAVLTRSLYWLRTGGKEHLPKRGGALLVANAVNHLDWLFLLASSHRRIRFVMFRGFPGSFGWLQRLAFRACDVLLLENDASEEDIARTAKTVADLVEKGELVCVFAERWQTSSSSTFRLPDFLAKIRASHPPTVIPVSMSQAWGSLFNFEKGRYRWHWPQQLPAGVEVAFGTPLAGDSAPGEVRQSLQVLSAQRAIARNSERPPVHRQFVRLAAKHPFRSCQVDSGTGPNLNYGKTLAGAMCLARELEPLLGTAQNVAVWLPPSTGGVLTNLALALLGKTSVNLNYTSSPEGIVSCLQQAECRVVLTARRFTSKMPLEWPGEAPAEIVYLEDLLPKVTKSAKLLAFLKVLLLPGWILERWVLGLGGHSGSDVATIIFSSGSTGDPKGVMLTHGNVAANVESIVQVTQLGHSDRLLGVLPFFHSFGYSITLWAPLQVGASSVYFPDPRAAREIGELCRKHGCTLFLSTATFLRFCLRKCEPDDFRTLRILICGAEKLPMSLADDFQAKFGVRPLEGYGCTELSPATNSNLPDREVEGLVKVFNKSGTIGPPFPGCAGKIVHPETFEPLPLGEEGLLLMSGANVMKGYLNKPELTQSVILDGWYVTGDMGFIDDEGSITLTGRLARFAKIGGEMVPLEKIEEELHETLHTSERICSVTCVPDPARGERLVVLYLHNEELEVPTLRSHLHQRGLPNLWVPNERDFFPVDELPILGTGKLNLRRVKEMALELAGGMVGSK